MPDFFTALYAFLVTLVGETFGTIFGGGSFFVQPGLIAAGIDPKITVANDIAAACFSSLAYIHGKRRRIRDNFGFYREITPYLLPGIFIGAWLGAQVLRVIPSWLVLWLTVAIASLGLLKMLLQYLKIIPGLHVSAEPQPLPHWRPLIIGASVFLGFYDGVSGAGSGTLQILTYALVFRRPMKELILLSAIYGGLSLFAASINFLFLGLLDAGLLLVMVPGAILAGVFASRITDIVSERHLELVFMLVLAGLLLYIAGRETGLLW